jgi:trehalose-phosphatase
MNGPTLLAFDFDGTLAPIHNDPTQVEMNRGAGELLTSATELRGVVVAVMSGRDAVDLAARVHTSGAYIVASHGLEIIGPGGVVIREEPELAATVDAGLREEIEASGMRLESKKHGIALHWRGIPEAAIAPVAESFREWARTEGLDVIEGRCVVEARTRGSGKEEALRWLAHAVGASQVLYAGDDITDFGALRFAARRGRAVFMSSAEREPPPGVEVVSSFRELFQLIREEVMM